MPIRRSHAKRVDPKDIRQVIVEYDGENMPVKYNLGALSPEAMDMLNTPARQLPGLARLLADILVSWEVVDDTEDAGDAPEDEKKILPINYRVLAEFPSGFLGALSSAIMDDVKVPKANTSSFKTG